MAKDVDVSVVSEHFEVAVLGSIPAIQNFLHPVVVITEPETNRVFVRLPRRVKYNIQTHAVTKWNVGCEKCHGPGSEHVKAPSQKNIVNPVRLNTVQATNICIQCHSQGQPLSNPISGKYYDWPVDFQPGKDLRNYWTLEEHKLGEQTFTQFPDGTAHKNRMHGNDFGTKRYVYAWRELLQSS